MGSTEKTAAELQAMADAAAWKEYLQAQKAKQAERIVGIQAVIDGKVKVIAEAKEKIKLLDAQLASGVVGKVPKPTPGGVVIGVPTGIMDAKGN
jgi:hypothetical protein